MEIIIRDKDVPWADSLSYTGSGKTKFREGVRAVVYDPIAKSVLILHTKGYARYEVIGGGIDGGETVEQALARELAEESGVVKFDLLTELSTIREYFERAGVERLNHAFLVVPTAPLELPKPTESEIADGYTPIWVPMDEALNLMDTARGESYECRFIWHRSKILVAEALEYIRTHSL